ncbi:sugar phosphate isomerase [Jannaschia sp. EhC01]|nr:sugar phosphate isomerase [Jannaschia sp. EhC01]
MRLAYHANCWGPLGGHPVGVTSIGGLSYMTFADMADAFRDIGAAGYTGVEIFDGNLFEYVDRKADLKALLDETGLHLLAVYSGANLIFLDVLEEELEKIRRTVDLAAEFGAEHFVVGGGAKRLHGPKSEDRGATGAGLERCREIAEKAGLQAHYHPHLSTLAETSDEIAEIFGHTSIHFCPDTAHLAAGGCDVPALIRQWADRISYVHLKGFQSDPFAFTPLGQGDLDMSAIVDALKDTEFNGWIATELDAWPDPAEGARESHAWLTAELAKT